MTVTQSAAAVRPRRGLLIVLSGNMLLDAIEVSLAIVALPAVATDLRLGRALASWVVAGFALGFGGTLIAGHHAAARWGERRIYLAALAVFAAASVAGALADSAWLLIASRVVKGSCAALTAPTGLAIIGRSFPEGPSRNRALAIYSAFGAWGFTVGLVLSGLITTASWRWTFLVPAPVALILLVPCARLLDRGPAGPRQMPRPAGREAARARRVPLPGVSARRRLATALGAAALNGSFWGLLILCAFRLQGHLGWSPAEVGAALLPASVPVAAIAPFAAALVGRFGTGRLVALGAALPPVGYLLTWALSGRPLGSVAAYAAWLLPGLLLVGAGFALCFSALHVRALTGLAPAAQRVATARYQTAVQLGGVIVVAIIAVPALSGLAVVTAVGVLGLLAALAGLITEERNT